MFELTEEPEFATIKASGKLKREDYDRFVPAFDRIAARRGTVPMLIDITELHGWEPRAAWEDLKFDVTHRKSMGPMAIVGDNKWEEWAINLSKPFFKSALKFFPVEQREEARRWLLDQVGAKAD